MNNNIEQTKSTVACTHSPNKCHDIFTKHLFSVVISYNFIFYYFILIYKKLTPQQLWKILWNLLCQYNNIYAGSYKYLKGKKKYKRKTEEKKML